MLPHLSPLNGGLAGAAVQVPPPPRFRAPVGEIRHVWTRQAEWKPSGSTAAQKAGLRYETEAQAFLLKTFPHYQVASFLHFTDDTGPRTCIPDGLCVDHVKSRVAIFEIKSQHMPEAWWQLRRLYEPVLRVKYPRYCVSVVEVCKSYDPQMPFPEKPFYIEDIVRFVNSSPDKTFGVLRWKK